jgi:hypothetical protein
MLRWPNVVYIVGVLFASVGKMLYLCSDITVLLSQDNYKYEEVLFGNIPFRRACEHADVCL